MTDNAIQITLDDVLGPDGLEGAWEGMVAKLARRAEDRFSHAESGKSFHKAAVDAINAAVAGKLAERIERLMDQPIQRTDNWGAAKGEPVTFNQMIGEAVESAMTARVDALGKHDPRGSLTMFEYALRNIALVGLDKAIRDEARKVNADAKAAVSKQIAASIAATLKA